MHNNGTIPFNQDPTEAIQSRVRRQMQADALQPLRTEEEEEEEKLVGVSEPLVLVDQFGTELLEEATQFLRLQVCSNKGDLFFFLNFLIRLKIDLNSC